MSVEIRPRLEKKNSLFSVKISEIRGKMTACDICNKDFSILVKEHQCKRCKRAVCYNCSTSKAPVSNIFYSRFIEC